MYFKTTNNYKKLKYSCIICSLYYKLNTFSALLDDSVNRLLLAF